MKNIFLFLGILLLISIFAYANYLGIFKTAKITEKKVGPYKLVYDDLTGPYHKIKAIQDRVYYSLKNDGIETFKGFGIYYDNPKTTPQEKLRSIGGCIIENKDFDKLNSLKSKYKIMDYPATQSIYTEFPFKNPLSVIIAIFKVYPEIEKYQSSKGYKPAALLEVYDIPNQITLFSAPIEK